MGHWRGRNTMSSILQLHEVPPAQDPIETGLARLTDHALRCAEREIHGRVEAGCRHAAGAIRRSAPETELKAAGASLRAILNGPQPCRSSGVSMRMRFPVFRLLPFPGPWFPTS